jgi:hypothetical protein
MDENKTRISYLNFAADLDAKYETEKQVHWLGQDITIKKNLTLPEMLAFVSQVVDVCYQGDGDVLIYTPEVQSYAVQHALVNFYTNIDLDEPDDDDVMSVYDFITRGDLIDLILQNINIKQYDEIIQAIGSKIKYINETNAVSIMSEMGSLNNAINEIVPQIQEFMSGENQEKLEAAMSALSVLSEDKTLRKLAIAQVKNG